MEIYHGRVGGERFIKYIYALGHIRQFAGHDFEVGGSHIGPFLESAIRRLMNMLARENSDHEEESFNIFLLLIQCDGRCRLPLLLPEILHRPRFLSKGSAPEASLQIKRIATLYRRDGKVGSTRCLPI